MLRTRIKSKLAHSWAYDAETKTLEIEFLRGRNDTVRPVWQYANVPQEKVEALQRADSFGAYFLVYIKRNYDGKKVEEISAENKEAAASSSNPEAQAE